MINVYVVKDMTNKHKYHHIYRKGFHIPIIAQKLGLSI